METLSQTRLHELFTYEDGELIWQISKGNAKAGKTAGCLNGAGYSQIQIDGQSYLTHRVVWMYIHGAWPTDQIDHINGIKTDNRINNLRECSPGENQQNRTPNKNSTSKFAGVSWFAKTKKWQARIGIQGKQKHIGYFTNELDAAFAYLEAKLQHHKFQPIPRT
ncbi:MAG: HNH endonuclease signature motif containing protein [Saprospiraceae bacterium]|nr:HNH endonuclease signature motif containing protein [Saprospiraceae bacterium]